MGKVLIIEDDMGIYELERDYLEIEGYEVDIQTNGIGLPLTHQRH